MIKIEGTWLDEKRTLRIEDRGPEVMLEISGSGCIRVSRQELIQKLHPEGAAEVEKYKKALRIMAEDRPCARCPVVDKCNIKGSAKLRWIKLLDGV